MKTIFLALLFLTACSKIEEPQTEAEILTEKTKIVETESTEKTEEVKTNQSVLSGLLLDGENDSRAYGVMIDNHSAARPQSGLSKAAVVYEFEVESDITRYLAIFSKEEVEEIGPIRSLRPYFIDTIREYGGLIVRFGGSETADEEVGEFSIDEINGMDTGVYIYRDSSHGKEAPHNAYSSSDLITQAMEDLGYQKPQTQGVFSFAKEFMPLKDPSYEARHISLAFNEYETTSYEYDQGSKSYRRFINEEVQKDAFYEEEIRPTNILILFMDMGHMENGIHRWMDNLGQGQGIYISGGRARDITWSKESREGKTSLSYEDGSQVILNPGQTWIENFNPGKAWEVK